MLITWTVKVAGRSGQQMLCRNEQEAAQEVLKLLLLGVKRKQLIVDGKSLEKANMAWLWKALDA